jgi:hypothetical protein
MPNKFNITASPIRNVILASGAAMTRPRGHLSPAEGSGVTIRIRYRILNARLAAGAVSGGGVDQAYDGWRVVSQFD